MERERAKVMDKARCRDDILTLQNVTKVYGSRLAVDRLCLSMKKAEVSIPLFWHNSPLLYKST